jgi:hypothetical protein
MEQIDISPTPTYWDGESPLFMIDGMTGDVRILRESGFDIDRWYEERKEAMLITSNRQPYEDSLEDEGP